MTTPQEVWKPLPPVRDTEFRGLVEISNLGRVRTWAGTHSFAGQRMDHPRPLKASVRPNGTLFIQPIGFHRVHGQRKYCAIQLKHAVAAAFGLKPDIPDMVLEHKNGILADCALDNLVWLPPRTPYNGKVDPWGGSHARSAARAMVDTLMRGIWAERPDPRECDLIVAVIRTCHDKLKARRKARAAAAREAAE